MSKDKKSTISVLGTPISVLSQGIVKCGEFALIGSQSGLSSYAGWLV
jgi:hypothetical protein